MKTETMTVKACEVKAGDTIEGGIVVTQSAEVFIGSEPG